MPVYVHRNLAGLAALASRDQGRYALCFVRVRDPGNGLYRCEATDGKLLAIVQGPGLDTSYPSLEQLGEGPAELLIPRDTWQQAFRMGDKRRPVGIGAGEDRAMLAVGDQYIRIQPGEGRYPDVGSVLPKCGPLSGARVNASLLVELLKLALAIEPNGGVNILYFGKGKPLGLATANEQGQTFDALLMPLS